MPNSPEMVEKMLDMAEVTTTDLVVDLGSGDGRNVIAAARRGARALGVEYNPDLVVLSTRNAEAAGVAGKASFVQGDMYEADFSQASVLALFLLPDNLSKLRPKFLDLKPGTRIVANTFRIPEWEPDVTTEFKGECTNWCTALLWIVPAKAGGRWQVDDQTLVLEQKFQMLTGTLTSRDGRAAPIERGRLRGAEISFVVGNTQVHGEDRRRRHAWHRHQRRISRPVEGGTPVMAGAAPLVRARRRPGRACAGGGRHRPGHQIGPVIRPISRPATGTAIGIGA